MFTSSYSTSITKVISIAALVGSTCAIANTQSVEISHSTTQASYSSKIKTGWNLVFEGKTSKSFAEQFVTSFGALQNDYEISNRNVLSELPSFKNLRAGWDGDDAEPIALGAINNAQTFLESYHGGLSFEAFPDPDGSVGLQADFSEGRVILSFDDAGEVAYLIRKNKAVHRGHGATHETINSLFSSLL